MVTKFKLTVINFARPNKMQTCACTWIYRWTKKLWKIRAGLPGRGLRATGLRAFGPQGCRAWDLLLAKPCLNFSCNIALMRETFIFLFLNYFCTQNDKLMWYLLTP